VQKRPALLGEVDGWRSLATTRLYPALFSTVKKAWAFCVFSLDGGFMLLPTKPLQLVLVGAVGNLPPPPAKAHTGADRGQQVGNGG